MSRLLLAQLLIVLLVPMVLLAEPVTSERIAALPADQQPAWRAYLERSQALARADQTALDAEVASNGMTLPLQAPDGPDFKLPAKAGDAWYSSQEARQLADVILSYQTPSGGWSKHTNYSEGPRRPGMQWTSQNKPDQPRHYVATFDNRATTEQLLFLAYMAHATGRADCREAFLKGLDFVFAAQYPNGGWPQGYPLEGGYHDHITFNDDAMTRIMRLLNAVATDQTTFSFVDPERRRQAKAALDAGVRCALELQVEIDNRNSIWCAQYDPITLEPAQARSFEPATLSGAEGARVLEFLMSVPDPSAELVTAIESGLAWLEANKVTDVRKVQRDGRTTYDHDPASDEVYWARFYDLKTGRPVFPDRQGVMHETYEAMAQGSNVGYDYYTTIPGGILNSGQEKWRKMLAQRQAN